MKKSFLSTSAKAVAIALIAVGFSACSSEEPMVVGNGPTKADNAINFTLRTGNMGRSATFTLDTEHYDFGVWAYKPTSVEVMDNYLVGYTDGTNGYRPTGAPTTAGSYWLYDLLSSSTSFVGSFDTQKEPKATQTLKYFDKNAANTDFYAYTPYNKNNTFTEATKTLVMASWTGTYNKCEAPMYGKTTVAKAEYDNDVKITFTRAHAVVGVAFIESVPGYKVEIIDLGGEPQDVELENPCKGIQALPCYSEIELAGSIKSYKSSKSMLAAGYTNEGTPTVVFGATEPLSYSNQSKSTSNLVFAAPTSAVNGTVTPVASATKFYAVPSQYDGTESGTEAIEANEKNNTSLYFHISFRLVSETNPNDVIFFYNVKVLVPAEYTQWAANKSYTYKFEITSGFKGGNPSPVDGADMDYTIDEDAALQPIKFAGVDIEDITEGNTITTPVTVH